MTVFRPIIFMFICSAIGSHHKILPMNSGSFHSHGILNQNTQDLFSMLGEHFQTLDQANTFCQKNLLRQGERWDTQKETPLFKKCKENEKAVMAYLKALGMIDASYPLRKKFKYVLCMGALKARAEQRLDTVAYLQNKGYSFDAIVLLGGARPLIESEKAELPHEINTEAGMMKHLYENHPTIKKMNTILIDAPMIELSNGFVRRPSTEDTLELFQKKVSDGGACLVVSNNPYLFRQLKVAQRILDQKKFPTDGAGSELDPKATNIFIVMDELARAINEEYKSLK